MGLPAPPPLKKPAGASDDWWRPAFEQLCQETQYGKVSLVLRARKVVALERFETLQRPE